MIVNFRACGISRDARKLARTPTLIKKKKKKEMLCAQLLVEGESQTGCLKEVQFFQCYEWLS
jgi:hypothetical protein